MAGYALEPIVAEYTGLSRAPWLFGHSKAFAASEGIAASIFDPAYKEHLKYRGKLKREQDQLFDKVFKRGKWSQRKKGEALKVLQKRNREEEKNMPKKYAKKRRSPQGGVYQGKRVPGRSGYIKRGSAPGIKTFKKKIRTKSAKRGGSSKLFDMVAPPLVVYNREFTPRGVFDDNGINSANNEMRTIDNPNYLDWVQRNNALTTPYVKDASGNWSQDDITAGFPPLGAPPPALLEVFSNILGRSGYHPSWMMYPILTTREAITYIMKAINTPRALAWDAHHHDVHTGNNRTSTAHTTIVDSIDIMDRTVQNQASVTPDTSVLMPANIDISNLYGTMEGFKMSYTVANMNECAVWLTVFECRPRDPIDSVSVPLKNVSQNAEAGGDPEYQNTTIDPLSLIKYDFRDKQLRNYSKYANGHLASDEHWPKAQPPNHLNSDINDDWKFTDDIRGREFSKHYVVLQKKTVCLKPGERFQYDVVIPGFGMRFDKYLKAALGRDMVLDADGYPTLGDANADVRVALAEMQSTFTRFLLFKHRSVRMFKLNNQTVSANGVVTPSWPIDGKQAYLQNCELTIRASKYFRTRVLPRREKRVNIRTSGHLDVDWRGQMPEYLPDRSLESKTVASWNGRNIYQVNRYPNLGHVVGASTTGTTTSINPSGN